MDYKTLFLRVRDHTGMYLSKGNFDEAAAFVLGCDAGNDFCLLHGFREWLILRVSWGNNLHWAPLVLRAAFPGVDQLEAQLDLSEDNRKHAVRTLFDLVIEFLEVRSSHDGLKAIFEAHTAWERRNGIHLTDRKKRS